MTVVKYPARQRDEASNAKLASLYEGVFSERIEEGKDWPAYQDDAAAKSDPLYPAKRLAEDVTKMFMLLCEKERVSPAEMVYAIELARLNIQRAEDCPLTKEQVEKVRGKAEKYHAESVGKLP
jgi:hypothetical protein